MKRTVNFLDKNNRRFHIEIKIEDGKFSMTGQSEGSFGQLYDSVVPANPYQEQLVTLWKKWHLNDMHAGTEAQEAALKSEAFEQFKSRMKALVEQAKAIEKEANMDIIEYARSKGKLVHAGGNSYQYPIYLKDELRVLKSGYKKRVLFDDTLAPRRGEDGKLIKGMTVEDILKSANYDYDMRCMYLKSINLYEVYHDGIPYRYGSGWVKRTLPTDIESQVDNVIEGIERLEKSKPAYVPAIEKLSDTRIRLRLPSLTAIVEYHAGKVKETVAPFGQGKKLTNEKVFKYKVHVTVEKLGDTSPDNNTFSFDYYGSINDYEMGKKMDADDLAFAIRNAISDAQSGYMDVDDFASEFGYDKPSVALRVWAACGKMKDDMVAVGFDEDLMINVLDELSNENIC